MTLELAGKSPAVVLPDYSIADTARRIAHGKGVNAGQVCIAPDYALVPRAKVDEFVAAVRASYTALYAGGSVGNADYTAVASDRHLARLHALLDDARAKGATVHPCAPSGPGRQLPLHVVTGCSDDMALLHEEIFGPLLPVLPYDTLDDAIAQIRSRPRPLALYPFTRNVAARERLLAHTHSGGVTVNDWAWHVINHDAPFGGVGNSGMGSYHGVEGFRELSHARTVLVKHRFFPIGLFYPPYGNVVQRLVMRLFVGKADAALRR